MKAIYNKLNRSVLAHDIDADYDVVLADITGMLKQTQKVAAMAFVLVTQLIRKSHEEKQKIQYVET